MGLFLVSNRVYETPLGIAFIVLILATISDGQLIKEEHGH
jgi:hypothetical protein